jgi:hypothetical protein
LESVKTLPKDLSGGPQGKSCGDVFEAGRPRTDKLRFFDAPTPGTPVTDPPAEPEGPESGG